MALPGSSRSRNQSRSCANDSGSMRGRLRSARISEQRLLLEARQSGVESLRASGVRQDRLLSSRSSSSSAGRRVHRVGSDARPPPTAGTRQPRRRAPASAASRRPSAPRTARARQLDGETLDARRHARGQQRVPAELEEVVVARRPAPGRSTSAQIPASTSSIGVRGATYRSRAGRVLRRRQRLPVHLAVRGQRQRVEHARTRRAPCSSGRRPPQVRRAALGSGLRLADDVRDQPLRRPARSSRDQTVPRRTAGCGRSSAASISPGSMRKPRIFTWWSTRPRNSSVPSGEPAHPVPRAVHPRPRPGERTGRGRTAPPSVPGRSR